LITQALCYVIDKLVRADLPAVLIAKDVEFHLIPATVDASIRKLVDLGEFLSCEGASPDDLHGDGLLRPVSKKVQHVVARPRSLSVELCELVSARSVNRDPAVIENRDLHKGVGALDDVGQDLAFR